MGAAPYQASLELAEELKLKIQALGRRLPRPDQVRVGGS